MLKGSELWWRVTDIDFDGFFKAFCFAVTLILEFPSFDNLRWSEFQGMAWVCSGDDAYFRISFSVDYTMF